MKVFFLDIDDCLIETSRLGKAELTALEKSLSSQKIPYASEITEEFAASFHRLYDHHQGKKLPKSDLLKLKLYMSKLKIMETNIIQKWGQIKKWSREVFIYISAEKFKIKLTPLQIEKSSAALWNAIASHTPFYPDALKFLQYLIQKKSAFYLITSSDCRLRIDQKSNQFTYDPDYSLNLKLKRLEKFIKLGIPRENIFIGDPYDKPDTGLFRQAVKKAEKDNPFPFTSVMVGDSLQNDLLPARNAGILELILINRNETEISDKIPIPLRVIESFLDIV